jgi:exodeoxyribonuclease-3
MKLLSWNVNGFRAVTGKPGWKSFCDGNADIVGLQETKAHETQIADEYRGREGMYTAWLSATVRKGYSGVAVFSRPTPLAVTLELPDPAWRGEGRLIHMEFEAFHFCNVYFPNGQMGEERLAYKLGYYDAFLEYAQGLRATKPVVVCGDFNTAHRPIDLARPRANKDTSGFLPVERAWLDKFVALGYLDTFRHIHGDLPDQYSWWSYRFGAREKNVGWRIDYFFVSEELRGAVKNAWINTEIAGSDHCPVGLELAL